MFPLQYKGHWGAINDNAVVVGHEATNGQATQWKDGIVTTLPRYSGCYAYAIDISSSGVVVGEDCSRPVCWINGEEVFLGGSGPDFSVSGGAECINSNGDIGGWYMSSGSSQLVPVIYSASAGSYQVLNFGGVLDNYGSFGINDRGDLVGQVTMAGEVSHWAFVYHNNTLVRLNTSGAEYNVSSARGINNLGMVVGYETIYGGGNCNAVLWEIGNPQPTILGTSAIAYAINDSGVAVGQSLSGNPVIFLDGQQIDLNTLVAKGSNVILSYAVDINNRGEILCLASISGYSRFCLLTPAPTITVKDVNDNSIPNVEFNLIKAMNDPPFFTEDTLGSFTTDSQGRLAMTAIAKDTFSVDLNTGTNKLVVGDSLKIAKLLQSVPSVRHPGIVGTMYSVHLDNAHFDDNGQMYFDVLKNSGLDVVMNHTEYRYNLLVSVEWDAVEAYQQGLQEDFQQMSNYLYDVTDGQLRLDTIGIVDDGELWEEADVHIRASNTHRPDAAVNAIGHPGWGPITMPRKWYGDGSRAYSYDHHPLGEALAMDYRTKGHEFGHYALAFYDEYFFCDQAGKCAEEPDLHCQPYPAGNYGFMDWQYEGALGGVRSSEMSSRYRYVSDYCRNTQQLIKNDTSCWDQFEEWAEGTFDGIYVPIRRPDTEDTLEHLTPPGLDYILGPNDNLAVPDYDVGAQIYFASPIQPPDPGNRSLNLALVAVPAAPVEVTLEKSLPGDRKRMIEQGSTTDDGMLWVLGASAADRINARGYVYDIINEPSAAAASRVRRQWLTASLDLSTVIGDSVSLSLLPIEGDYPLVLTADVAIAPQRWRLEFAEPFTQLPSVQFLSQSGQPLMPTVTQLTDNYNMRPADSIAAEGQVRLDAVDAVGQSFFVPFSYVTFVITDSTQLEKQLGPGNRAILSLSPQNSTITKTLIAASSYPPIMTGLEADAVQAGDAYAVSVAPTVALTGINQLTIAYEDEDLMAGDSVLGDESQLKMYRWHEGLNIWQYVGGLVDTSGNNVTAEISTLGTFALFTTKSPVGVEDELESPLPYRFEVSQNYPNPFNPTTTIEYSVPVRSQVTIEIFNVLGQQVRTLVNEPQSAGSYRVEWNGSDKAGNSVSTGVYLYRFQAGDVVQTKKMLLIK
ncbi:MAG TPA: T9SS type A sorting domain-containing protein [candidate division Zixibacteria bacterium]|nr:T9SS type A sorting domain-containing protein [candidate division Zixibacteria bacterium]MDD4917503.1 T9SS type A sorting domain-containing protein [candidate division Zixibacteria bacterium]HPM36567.1 T9SS type A sorting domain-containing protein [candidate division Zixibacteria bacterium]